MKRWRCLVCSAITLDDALLRLPDGDVNTGFVSCPNCGAVDQVDVACHAAGCANEPVVDRWSADGGIRHLCEVHRREPKEQAI